VRKNKTGEGKMSRIVCFIDKDTGQCGTCMEEARGVTDINCKKCDVYKKFKGKEKENFEWWRWKKVKEK
jgi:hypothetical protein